MATTPGWEASEPVLGQFGSGERDFHGRDVILGGWGSRPKVSGQTTGTSGAR